MEGMGVFTLVYQNWGSNLSTDYTLTNLYTHIHPADKNHKREITRHAAGYHYITHVQVQQPEYPYPYNPVQNIMNPSTLTAPDLS